MTNTRRYQVRRVVIGASALGVLAGVVVVAAPSARAATTGPVVACGYSGPANTYTGDCVSLSTAIATAELTGQQVTMLPGDYCPIDVPPPSSYLTINGAGETALKNAVPAQYEASVVTFKYSKSACGSTAPTAMVSETNAGTGNYAFFLTNVTLDGTADSGVGPSIGLDLQDGNIELSDAIVQNFSGDGVDAELPDGGALEIDHSAILGNATGIAVAGAASHVELDESTVAGNGVGIDEDTQQLGSRLFGDTVAHNTTGMTTTSTGSSSSFLVDTVLAGNTTDCAGSNISASRNNNNLLGSTCAAGTADVSYDGTTVSADAVPAVADNGGPTPSILPTPQTLGGGETDTVCVIDGDQRRAIPVANASCAIGGVQPGAGQTPMYGADQSSIDFGSVHDGDLGRANLDPINTGAGVLALGAVSVSGSGFSLEENACDYATLTNTFGQPHCPMIVDARPQTAGVIHGALTFTTTDPNAKTVTVPLTVTGTPPERAASAPGRPTAKPGVGMVTLTWTAPKDPGDGSVTNYAIRDSTDGGKKWVALSGTTGLAPAAELGDLRNGRAYVFDVAAISRVGVGSWSKSSAPVVPGVVASLAISGPSTTTAGHRITLRAHLVSSHSPVAGATLLLLASVGHGFHKVGTVRTSKRGTAHRSVKVARTTTYEWQFDPKGDYAGSKSRAHKVLLRHARK